MKDPKLAVTIRFPKDLGEVLRKRARKERRSLNTLVIVLLEQVIREQHHGEVA